MLTLTLRHDLGMPLKDTIRATKRAWRRMRQRRDVRDLWKALAHAPVTACEVTWGENGWHPHLHVAFRVGRALEPGEADLLDRRWQEAIVAELGARARPNEARGLVWSKHFEATDDGDRAMYVAKLGIELEIADPGLAKTGRNRTPFEIAAAAARGDQRSLALWIEYHRGTKGLHFLQLSPEAADAARQSELDQQAEYIAEHQDDDAPPERVDVVVPPAIVRAMRGAEYRWPCVFHSLLCAAEQGQAHGARAWMARHFPQAMVDHGGLTIYAVNVNEETGPP